KADAPIAEYQGFPDQQGVGGFGPTMEWKNMFIDVNKKYDFDHRSNDDIIELIEDKLQKEKDKVMNEFKEEGIRIEKERWGSSVILQGKVKIELSKDVDAAALTLDEIKELIEKKAPAKKTTAKKVASKTTKKTPTTKRTKKNN